MATQANNLILELESMVLQSRTLTLEDKKLLLYSLPKLSEMQLMEMKDIFEAERKEYTEIAKRELLAWKHFKQILTDITNRTKLN